MRRPGKAGWTGTAAAIAAAIALLSLGPPTASGGFETRTLGKPVSCKYLAASATMLVTVRDTRTKLDLPRSVVEEIGRGARGLTRIRTEPTAVKIERRRDAIVVLRGADEEFVIDFDEPSETPVACSGGNPTVFNTDEVVVRNGRHTEESRFELDLTYGELAPGLTPEADESSEIELDVATGGIVSVRMSRETDGVGVAQAGARTAVNLNLHEGGRDTDLLVGRRSEVLVNSAGAGDTLETSKPEKDPDDNRTILAGGQGDDSLGGGPGADRFFPGTGADDVLAAGGNDTILVNGKGRDLIDCGPGDDLVWVFGRTEPTTDRCESVEVERFPTPLGNELSRRAPASARPLARKVQHLRD